MEWNRIMYPGSLTKIERQAWYEENIKDLCSGLTIYCEQTREGTTQQEGSDFFYFDSSQGERFTLYFLSMNKNYGETSVPYMYRDGFKLRGTTLIEKNGDMLSRDKYGSNNNNDKICFDTYTDALSNKILRIGYEKYPGPSVGIIQGKCLNLENNQEEQFSLYYTMTAYSIATLNSNIDGWMITLPSIDTIYNAAYTNSSHSVAPFYLSYHDKISNTSMTQYQIKRYIHDNRVFPFYSIIGPNYSTDYEEFLLDGKRWCSLPYGIVIPLSE